MCKSFKRYARKFDVRANRTDDQIGHCESEKKCNLCARRMFGIHGRVMSAKRTNGIHERVISVQNMYMEFMRKCNACKKHSRSMKSRRCRVGVCACVRACVQMNLGHMEDSVQIAIIIRRGIPFCRPSAKRFVTIILSRAARSIFWLKCLHSDRPKRPLVYFDYIRLRIEGRLVVCATVPHEQTNRTL